MEVANFTHYFKPQKPQLKRDLKKTNLIFFQGDSFFGFVEKNFFCERRDHFGELTEHFDTGW